MSEDKKQAYQTLYYVLIVFPNLNYIESGHAELAMRKIRANLVDAHINTEIDIVTLDKEDNPIIFGECKYQAGKVGSDVFQKYGKI